MFWFWVRGFGGCLRSRFPFRFGSGDGLLNISSIILCILFPILGLPFWGTGSVVLGTMVGTVVTGSVVLGTMVGTVVTGTMVLGLGGDTNRVSAAEAPTPGCMG